MKRSKVVRLVAMGGTAAALAGCDQPPVNTPASQLPYASVEECIESGGYTETYCREQFEAVQPYQEQDDNGGGGGYYYGGGRSYPHKYDSYSSHSGFNHYKPSQQRTTTASSGGFGRRSFGFGFGS